MRHAACMSGCARRECRVLARSRWFSASDEPFRPRRSTPGSRRASQRRGAMRLGDLGDKLKGAIETVQDKVEDVVHSAKDKAPGLQEQAKSAADSATAKASDLKAQAQDAASVAGAKISDAAEQAKQASAS